MNAISLIIWAKQKKRDEAFFTTLPADMLISGCASEVIVDKETCLFSVVMCVNRMQGEFIMATNDVESTKQTLITLNTQIGDMEQKGKKTQEYLDC